MTVAQEHALVIAAERGDPDACRELVEAYLPAIVGLARQFPSGAGVERQELVQDGVAGLLFAARRFDPGVGTPFWPYASFWVRKAMQELVAELARPIVLSDRAVRGLAEIRRARRAHLQEHATEPTDVQLAEATGLPLEQIRSLLAADHAPRGIDEPLAIDATATLGDTITDPVAEEAYDEALDRVIMAAVRSSLEDLDQRERSVVRSHYGLGGPPQTLAAIGASLGLTAERARQIEVHALAKLRDALTRPATLSEERA
jgi:RNA polymerase sigma factor (sigma-70 family)